MVAYFTRLFGPAHLDLAEETVQEAMLRALQTWPYQGVPENAAAWLFRVARNSAIDAIRSRRLIASDDALAEIARPDSFSTADPLVEEQLRDDELSMIFMCCHPEISQESSVALSLKTVGGFSVREIARAFLDEETTVAQRLVRAKRQIRERGLSLDMPRGEELKSRLDSVLETIYLIFNEGYTAHEGEDLIRQDLCVEALRLGRLVATSSIGTPKSHALVAMMALQAARLPARVNAAGELVLLEKQDRNCWDRELIGLGFHHFDLCMSGDQVTEYHAQAAIAATHARAGDAESIEWPWILEFYDQLMAINPSPVVALNRAVAVAKVHGAERALAEVERLEQEQKLRDYYLLLAVRGHLLFELGRGEEAAENFQAALEMPCSEPERRFLRRKLEACRAPLTSD